MQNLPDYLDSSCHDRNTPPSLKQPHGAIVSYQVSHFSEFYKDNNTHTEGTQNHKNVILPPLSETHTM
jgi:hypothetical protein